MNKKIGIIGCGWLGLPLAENLISEGYFVKGTTTSKEKLTLLEEKGITPFQISLSEEGIHGNIEAFLEGVTILIVNIPPKLRGNGPKESYISKIKLLHTAINKSQVINIIFVSSTAVYGEAEGIVTEKTIPIPTTESGKQLLQCEDLFKNDAKLETTIIRFGGLIGPNRHPITMLAGKENMKGGHAPVNLIHLDDCIGIILAIINHEYWNEVLNAVYPEHPTKKEYYTKLALDKGLTPPTYQSDDTKTYKLINSCKFFLIKDYTFFTSIY
ncbi:SDR family oxidoreductase [Maribacter hydrothermalis]|uniref:NAD(P)-dependent oxidoreductase n=1 Tax=Maribacter hydrothermalis TaxID=1836467 RepID=A0A1B7ZEX2_9FLAO|nr:SDR family oxidoreductase [Maribacter hydrothermalis]APQ17619.1 NAD(P)-dependent oxidoreductase [Maribacter hydrothermalis]OBR42093.1 NAD(P)-dependent oxidoreductase [Maribacter hydrothermalis]